MVNGLTMDSTWNTVSTGTEVTSVAITGNQIWLRAPVNVRPGATGPGRFSYTLEGITFRSIVTDSIWLLIDTSLLSIGIPFSNFATQSLGGSLTVRQFELAVA